MEWKNSISKWNYFAAIPWGIPTSPGIKATPRIPPGTVALNLEIKIKDFQIV